MVWTKKDQLTLETYLVTTDEIIRRSLMNELVPSFTSLINMVIFKFGNAYILANVEDVRQELYLKIFEDVITSIDINKVKAFLYFTYICLRNDVYRLMNEQRKQLKHYNIDNNIELNEIELLTVDNDLIEDIRIQIIDVINDKMNDEKYFNIYKSIYLQMLKDYLIANNFEPTGFRELCMQQLNINENMFRSISSSLKISVKEFDYQLNDPHTVKMLKKVRNTSPPLTDL